MQLVFFQWISSHQNAIIRIRTEVCGYQVIAKPGAWIYMSKVISIGKQDYASLREEDYFFIDKTNFIKKWWEAGDEITLIARPRRFGKTLNMSMLNCFFSNQYADRSDLFQGLSIWKEKKYQKLQGTYPVIFLSFADVKQTNYKDAICKIKRIIAPYISNI